ncbi:hypothetical protein FHX82_005734 [Amycolatopsis bartoniae]|uniref:DUF1707 domain-containing protein n=1 Tax=Amycolatopsis bartoniae TaxID=941986 RepID=A0A8H9J6G5_9PSEU|nr:DUF1707 domain-containing protein [Amycolatopsis bartoniae]MBB2938656.1 hypothetical protein [Amycolatopsis bartoniae]TVT08852.1 DUF1707 domain-containing protein [Amycolatopsis bartoniae]GHF83919.1 hypothetical protein GCM10017566_67520 [Amycolatopsis bartoniae]
MNTSHSTPQANGTDAEEIPAGAQRCSDAERERTSAHLQAAAGEGRLAMDEVEDRLARTYAARYRHELEAITADLPRDATPAGWGAVLALAGRQLQDDLAALTGRANVPAGRRRTVVLTLAALTIVLFAVATVVLALHGIVGDGPDHHGFPRE